MRFFSERNPLVVGAIGLALTAAAVIGSPQYKQLPFFDSDGPRVRVKFKIDKAVHVGDRTEEAVKTKSLLGARSWRSPRGKMASCHKRSHWIGQHRPASCPTPSATSPQRSTD